MEALLVASRETGVGVNAQETDYMVMYREQNAGKNPLRVWQKFIFVNNSDNIEMAFMKKFRTQ
jgi:hypothetical protein